MKIPFPMIPFVFADGVERTSQSDALPYPEMRVPNSSFAFFRGGQPTKRGQSPRERKRERGRDPFKARF